MDVRIDMYIIYSLAWQFISVLYVAEKLMTGEDGIGEVVFVFCFTFFLTIFWHFDTLNKI